MRSHEIGAHGFGSAWAPVGTGLQGFSGSRFDLSSQAYGKKLLAD